MKILYGSDLHQNHKQNTRWVIPEDQDLFDLICICGDISDDCWSTLTFLEKLELSTSKDILALPGNHDRFQFPISESEEALKHFRGYMNRRIFEFKGQRILGLTNWYNPSRLKGQRLNNHLIGIFMKEIFHK